MNAKLAYVELCKGLVELQVDLFGKVKQILALQLAEAWAHQEVTLSEMADCRDLLQDEVDRWSSGRSALCVELKKTRCQFSAVGAKTGTEVGLLTEQKTLTNEAE